MSEKRPTVVLFGQVQLGQLQEIAELLEQFDAREDLTSYDHADLETCCQLLLGIRQRHRNVDVSLDDKD